MRGRQRKPARRRSRKGRRGRGAAQDHEETSIQLSPPQPRGDLPRRPKRTYVTSSVSRPLPTSEFCFRQIVDVNYITSSNAAGVGGIYSFTLGALDGVTTLGSLFDQYMIAAVTMHVVPTANAVQVLQPGATNMQPLYLAVDYDGGTTPTSQAFMRQYDSCIELAPGESCERTIRPRVEFASIIGGVNTNVGSISAPWCDCAVTTLKHFGFVFFTPQAIAAQTTLQQWEVFFEYFVVFRSVR
jgi:hypothetical protein